MGMKIMKIQGNIRLLSGLHIGGGDDTMKIGGVDNQVIRDINSDKPYIPGSSLKGKMRSLLEWDCGVVNLDRNKVDEVGKPLSSEHIFKKDGSFHDVAFNDEKLLERAETLLKLFGDKDGKYGITRINVGDCRLIEEGLQYSESKYENVIDRQKGTAEHPRQTERVPAGISFNYDIRLKILNTSEEEALKAMLKRGMELVENDYLGGNGSRGYGRVEFSNKSEWTE